MTPRGAGPPGVGRVAEVVRRCVAARAADPTGTADGSLAEALRAAPAGAVARCAVRHAVGNLLHLTTRDDPLRDERAAATLAAGHRSSAVAHLRTLVDLERVGQVLDAADVPWLVCKGPVLTEVVHAARDLRAYSDLDVLVDPDRFDVALDALVRAGAEVLDRNWARLVAERRGQVHLALPSGTVLDLHWHLVNLDANRADLHLPPGDLIARARTVDLGEQVAPTLDPVDTLLHLCLHAALAGAARLSWAFDVDQAVRRDQTDWDEVTRRAAASGARVPVAAVLLRASSWLATPVPPGTIAALVPSVPARRTMRRLAAVPPRADASVTRLDDLGYRCLRDRPGATARAAAAWSGGKLARTSARRGDVFTPAGDDAVRATYLAGVPGWARATGR